MILPRINADDADKTKTIVFLIRVIDFDPRLNWFVLIVSKRIDFSNFPFAVGVYYFEGPEH
jgi:hypothetical protein